MDDSSSPPDDVTRADAYRHADGTLEVVFGRESGRVLTVREYPDVEAFEAAQRGATYCGEHDAVAALPDPTAFADDDPDSAGE